MGAVGLESFVWSLPPPNMSCTLPQPLLALLTHPMLSLRRGGACQSSEHGPEQRSHTSLNQNSKGLEGCEPIPGLLCPDSPAAPGSLGRPLMLAPEVVGDSGDLWWRRWHPDLKPPGRGHIF